MKDMQDIKKQYSQKEDEFIQNMDRLFKAKAIQVAEKITIPFLIQSPSTIISNRLIVRSPIREIKRKLKEFGFKPRHLPINNWFEQHFNSHGLQLGKHSVLLDSKTHTVYGVTRVKDIAPLYIGKKLSLEEFLIARFN